MIVTIVVFVLIFGVVVIAHELGHFLIAKLNGIKVVQFSIGMGPDLIKFTKGDTKYVLKLLPIGGACMFEGEDGVYSDKKDTDEKEAFNAVETKPEGAFNDANVWARIATVFAGPFFNIILSCCARSFSSEADCADLSAGTSSSALRRPLSRTTARRCSGSQTSCRTSLRPR